MSARRDSTPPRVRGARLRGALCALSLVLAAPALAGSPARYGGTLKVAAVVRGPQAHPFLADTPLEATLATLSTTPLCRAATWEWTSPKVLRLTPRAPFTAAHVAQTVERAMSDGSPYRGLLSGLSQTAPDGDAVRLTFTTPWPDAARALCHPALAVGPGPFQAKANALEANARHPDGRPFVDTLTVQQVDRRQADRLFAQRRVHVALGAGSALPGPQLYATYLLPSSRLPSSFAQAVEATVDRADLVRFFVAAPASPLFGVLPAGLGGPAAPPERPKRPAALTPAREISVLYDASLADQRAVAERLQVKLQPLGYRVAVEGVQRAQLRERWRAGTYDVLLFGVLLPPAPAPALAVALEVGKLGPRAATVLNAAAAEPDAAARDALAVAAASTVRDAPLIPLYVQGLAAASAGGVQRLEVDAQGLLRLDDAFLAEE